MIALHFSVRLLCLWIQRQVNLQVFDTPWARWSDLSYFLDHRRHYWYFCLPSEVTAFFYASLLVFQFRLECEHHSVACRMAARRRFKISFCLGWMHQVTPYWFGGSSSDVYQLRLSFAEDRCFSLRDRSLHLVFCCSLDTARPRLPATWEDLCRGKKASFCRQDYQELNLWPSSADPYDCCRRTFLAIFVTTCHRKFLLIEDQRTYYGNWEWYCASPSGSGQLGPWAVQPPKEYCSSIWLANYYWGRLVFCERHLSAFIFQMLPVQPALSSLFGTLTGTSHLHWASSKFFHGPPSHQAIYAGFQALFRGRISAFFALVLRKCSSRALPITSAFQNSSDPWRLEAVGCRFLSSRNFSRSVGHW